ncbi:MAG: Trm112 family protein [Propionibacteriaceae bacterium]|nr:Trm112 family protein [Propionibacteriaceae bacterium]
MNQKTPINAELLDLLVCPSCRSQLALDYESNELVCTSRGCALAYPVLEDVPVLLVDEARKPL